MTLPDNETTAVYRRARAAGIPASHAIRIARWQPTPPPTALDGFTIRVSDEPDTDWSYRDAGYGTLMAGDEDGAGNLRRPHPDAIRNRDGSRRNGDAWFIPEPTVTEMASFNRRAGMSRSVALDRAMEDARRQLRDLTYGWGPDVRYIAVTASRAGIDLATVGCGGVVVAWDDIRMSSGEEYVWEVAADLATEAVAEAREALARLLEDGPRAAIAAA